MKNCIVLLFIIFLTLSHSISYAIDDNELDKLSLASLLIKNENYARASGVLGSIKDPHDVQTDRYYTLLGVLALKQKQYKKAIENLLLAEKSGVSDSEKVVLEETIVKALIKLKKYEDAEKRLVNKKNILKTRPAYYQVTASLYFETKRPELGWDVLNEGIKKFDHVYALKKQKWFYLFENGLYEQSKDFLLAIVPSAPLSSLDLIKMAYRYRMKGLLKTASIVGEMAWLKSQKNIEVAKELARIHIESGQVMAAASVFETLSHTYPRFRLEASELWRKAGHSTHALNIANQITDESKSLKQKITLALDRSDFTTIATLGPMTLRNDLKKNEDIQYTIAYAQFMTGRFNYVERYLKNISRSDLFNKALALRKTNIDCMEEEWSCL